MALSVLAFLETVEASVEQTDTFCDRLSVPVGAFAKLAEFLHALDRVVDLFWLSVVQFVKVEALVISFDEQADRTSDAFSTGRIQFESGQIIQSAIPTNV
jgi:hypothetical protein